MRIYVSKRKELILKMDFEKFGGIAKRNYPAKKL